MNYEQIVDLAFIAARILQSNGVTYNWTELKGTAQTLSETEPNLDAISLAEFYELHA
jgi:hypothetical protein